VYDKTVRRRRAVLGLLVACSLILLTAYFGESRDGALHAVQRGTSAVLNPVQEGASRALKPVRDLFGWFGDTLAAKGQVAELRAERDRLRTEALRNESLLRDNRRLSSLLELDGALGLEAMGPKTGRVIFQSPTVWYATIRVDKGSDDGVRVGHPVINEEALIGRVTQVFGGSAQVTLITDTTMKVPARPREDLDEVEAAHVRERAQVDLLGVGALVDDVRDLADRQPGRVQRRAAVVGLGAAREDAIPRAQA
jgi:rod shape-determining protein MreC